MSLFQFSSEGDGAYYTDIASRYLQLIVKLIDEAGVPKGYQNDRYVNQPQVDESIF